MKIVIIILAILFTIFISLTVIGMVVLGALKERQMNEKDKSPGKG